MKRLLFLLPAVLLLLPGLYSCEDKNIPDDNKPENPEIVDPEPEDSVPVFSITDDQSGEVIESFDLPYEGGEIEIMILCGGSWTMTVPSWITADKSAGEGNTPVRLTVSANTGESRSGEAIFKSGDETITLAAVQAMAENGSEAYPILIRTASDMTRLRTLLEMGEYKYVKLVNDIDMSPITDWAPIHEDNDNKGIRFDGNGKTISNFRVVKPAEADCVHNYMSLFGILHGSVKNLTIKDPEIVYNRSTPVGILAGWAGNSDGSCFAEIENVHVINGKVTSRMISGNLGGLVGSTHATTFKNCSFDGTVTREVVADEDNTYRYTGGLIGLVYTAAEYMVSLDGCHTSGKVAAKAGRAVGGLIAGINAKARVRINNCWSTMDVEARHDVVGGLVGYWGGGEFNDCHYSGNISTTKGTNSFAGGIVAHSNWEIIMRRCWSEGTITTSGAIVGGLAGQSNAVADGPTTGLEISECWSSMIIKSGSGDTGGLVGRSSTNHPLSISNSYFTGSLTAQATNKSNYGGIIGDCPKNSTITNCWSSADIKAGFAMGGIAGRMFGRQGASADQTADIGCSATGNIFTGTIQTTNTSGESASNHYSAAAIIGFNSTANTLKNNWRGPGVSFSFYANAADNSLFDQDDADKDHPLTDNRDHGDSAYKYYRPYHGKAASSGETVSAIAARIGWDTSVWDLSGSTPTLKNSRK